MDVFNDRTDVFNAKFFPAKTKRKTKRRSAIFVSMFALLRQYQSLRTESLSVYGGIDTFQDRNSSLQGSFSRFDDLQFSRTMIAPPPLLAMHATVRALRLLVVPTATASSDCLCHTVR